MVNRLTGSIEHLRWKLSILDNRLRRKWPKWSDKDYIAVRFLLDEIERLLRLPQNEEGETQEIVARWLDQNFDGNTWERELVRVSELLEQLGIAFIPPTRWIEDVSQSTAADAGAG